MAVLIMAHNNNSTNTMEEKPIFHDFMGTISASDSPAVVARKSVGFGSDIRLSEASVSASASIGASSGGHAPISATSDLGSERQVGSHFEGVPFYGPRSDFSGPEVSTILPGRKRSNSDSTFMGMGDRMPQMGPDSLENLHLKKVSSISLPFYIFLPFSSKPLIPVCGRPFILSHAAGHVAFQILQNGAGGDRSRRSYDENLFYGMQTPRPISTSSILQSPIGSRPDFVVSKWEGSMPMNAGPIVQCPPHLGQFSPLVDKVSSSRYRDTNAGPSLISQPAADEGSRTGIKGSGILSSINASSGGPERNSSGLLPATSRQKSGIHIPNPESSDPPSRHGLTSASRQMTIFYAGQAHVFDDVHPNKVSFLVVVNDGCLYLFQFSNDTRFQSLLHQYAFAASLSEAEGNLFSHENILISEAAYQLACPFEGQWQLKSSCHTLRVDSIDPQFNNPSALQNGFRGMFVLSMTSHLGYDILWLKHHHEKVLKLVKRIRTAKGHVSRGKANEIDQHCALIGCKGKQPCLGD
ncbi:hypothetical protein HHK36_025713 [Tetracentron sinense]|uniref:Protein TIFY n=1 Tax=Tetracentron sinense TaxID=13715 RepID=A0A835D3A6_TETSI|nr:hypothetical protein HHK36_025713 [Tetracentron sinense]